MQRRNRTRALASLSGKARRRIAAATLSEPLEDRRLLSASIVGRYIFYNNSSFDGNNTAINSSDDNAIATDKSALLPGATAGAANETGYKRGINGIAIDVSSRPSGTITASDFNFFVGTSSDPSTWTAAPAPADVEVRSGAGTGGSDRLEVTWTDNAIQNQWLQVTLKADHNTGLQRDDVFYFGNLVGDTNGDYAVNSTDGNNITADYGHTNAPVTDGNDLDKDGNVNFNDSLLYTQNNNHSLTTITAPTSLIITAVPAPDGNETVDLYAGQSLNVDAISYGRMPPTILGTSNPGGGSLLANTQYHYMVTATVAAGETLASTELSYTTPNSSSSIQINWKVVPGATGYTIYRSKDTSGTHDNTGSQRETYLATVTGGSSTSYDDTGTQTQGGSQPPMTFSPPSDIPYPTRSKFRWDFGDPGASMIYFQDSMQRMSTTSRAITW